MGILKTKDVLYEYFRRDDEGNIDGITVALDHVDIDINQGDFVAILGHNGSGKSTLARHLNALMFPEEGTVWIDGRDSKAVENSHELRRVCGMVFQNPDNQIIASVVEEDVAFGPENLGVPQNKLSGRVSGALDMTEMKVFAKKNPNHLSGGQKQRVAIAGVLAMESPCIVLDEPTAMLDPKGRRDVLETMRFLNREKGITIILITHNMEEAVDADVIHLMKDGKVYASGSPREIFSRPRTVEACGLELPVVTQIAHGLKQNGLDIRVDVLNEAELCEEIVKGMNR